MSNSPSPVSPIELLPRALPIPRAATPSVWVRRLVWLVPAAIVVVVAWLAAQALAGRGPTVTIVFATAEGLEPHKTAIKYNSVHIGVVRSIDLLDDRSGVMVTAQLSRQAERLLATDTRFWVVRPRVSLTGVSGIGTLITGAHIAVAAGRSQESRNDFIGLEAPPLTVTDRPGRRFSLRAESVGSLDVGSPVYLRRFQVGQVSSVGLEPGGRAALLEVFVDAPHHEQVTANTRFWNASGLDVTVNTRGIQLDTQSLASMLMGGIAFETPADAPEAPTAEAGDRFPLHLGREAALQAPAPTESGYRLVFRPAVRGLVAGTPVDLAGLDIGRVVAVDVDFDPETGNARTIVDLSLRPARAAETPGDWRALLDRLVARGLRARVRIENILTAQRYVALEFVRGAPRTAIDWTAQPIELPTAAGDPGDVPAAVGRLVAKLDKVPIGELVGEGTQALGELRRTLQGTSRLVGRIDSDLAPGLLSLMGQAKKTLGTVDGALSADAPLQQELRGAMRDVSGAAQTLRSLAEYLERHPESLIRGKKEDGRW